MMGAVPCEVALLTPPGRGAVATLLVAGKQATAMVDRHFCAAAKQPLSEFPIGRIAFGRWRTTQHLALGTQYSVLQAGEELVVCRTAEDEVEIHCHGGSAASCAIIDALVADGCHECDWRNWLHATSVDRLAAEAQIALADAATTNTAAILLDQMHGALRREMEVIVDACQSRDRQQASERLTTLAARGRLGLHLTKPFRVVLAGRPNVGKSSLMNALLGYTRAMVFDEPGTTRDVVTAKTAIEGWPVELSDTAGLRLSSDAVETEGVARARRAAAQAHLLVLVFDATQPWTAEDQSLVDDHPQSLVVINKIDRGVSPAISPSLPTSALTGQGVAELTSAIGQRLVPIKTTSGEAVPFRPSHVEAIGRALDHAAASEFEPAASELRRLL